MSEEKGVKGLAQRERGESGECNLSLLLNGMSESEASQSPCWCQQLH